MLLQYNYKYIAVSKSNDRVLCDGGWKLIDKLAERQIKLFPTPSHLKNFFEVSKWYQNCEYEVKKVKVRIEVEDYE